MGHLASFGRKEKEGRSKTFKAAGPVTVHICCVVSHVRMFAHVFVRWSLAAESSCSTLGSLHIWRPAAASGHRGWPPDSSDQERWRRKNPRLRTNGEEQKADMVKGGRSGFVIAEQ